MSKFDTLVKLIREWESFTEQTGTEDLSAFGFWLIQSTEVKPGSPSVSPDPEGGFHHFQDFFTRFPVETQLSILGNRLNKIARWYVKLALADTKIQSTEEFGIMAALEATGSLGKMQLVNQILSEMTTGIAIINRLRQQGLVEEFQDEHDRRIRKVKLTEEGKHLVAFARKQLTRTANMVYCTLKPDEQMQLLGFYTQLNNLHMPVFLHDESKNFDEVEQKLKGSPENTE